VEASPPMASLGFQLIVRSIENVSGLKWHVTDLLASLTLTILAF
jgi:hypothetical protein